jgi:hypothetical protein
MDAAFDLGRVPTLAQADFLRQLGPVLWQHPNVWAIWLEGGLGRGNADRYRDPRPNTTEHL